MQINHLYYFKVVLLSYLSYCISQGIRVEAFLAPWKSRHTTISVRRAGHEVSGARRPLDILLVQRHQTNSDQLHTRPFIPEQLNFQPTLQVERPRLKSYVAIRPPGTLGIGIVYLETESRKVWISTLRLSHG